MPLLTKPRPAYRHKYGDIYQMTELLQYRDNVTNEIYEAEAGFTWNKASITKFLPRAIVPHGDEFTYPSAIHDKHYEDRDVPRRVADRVMRQFLIEEFDYAYQMENPDDPDGKHPLGRPRAWLAWSIVRLNMKAAYFWNKKSD